jgi:hypothetical protein
MSENNNDSSITPPTASTENRAEGPTEGSSVAANIFGGSNPQLMLPLVCNLTEI